MLGTQELINQIGLLSYVGIWFVALISNVFIPVPEEVVLLIFGYLSAGPKINGFILFPIVLSGLLVSDIIMYFFSRRGNKLVSGFYDKVFASRLESRKEWIVKHLNKVIFFSRFLVQLRFLGPFFAGQTKMPFRKFLFIDTLALLIYVSLYLLIGRYFRSRIDFITNGIGIVKNIIITIVLITLLISFIRFLRRYLLKLQLDKSNKDTHKNGKQN